ncbi:MAG: LpqB family beta-propeller domain-containing protein [Actinomycetes bacterium]
MRDLLAGRCRRGRRGAAPAHARVVLGARALVVLVVLVTALPGCASIPSSGPVLEGRSGERDNGDLRVIPPNPARGASPEEIVRGFLLAVGETDSEYTTARKFLTQERRTDWRPDAGTVVYGRQGPQIVVTADGRAVPTADAVGAGVDRVQVKLRVLQVATIDARGRYTAAASGTTRDFPFVLRRVDGEWRISELPDGVLVADSFLRLAYRTYRLYFLDPSLTMLVPETRWFPHRDSNATMLTRELLAGPSEWLAGAVRSSFPTGTALAPPSSVRIEDGVAIVDLSSQVLKTTPEQRGLMLAQLEQTLLPVEDVSDVTIRVEGREIDLPPAATELLVDPGVDSWPVLVQDDRLVRLRPGGRVDPIQGLPDLFGRGLSHPAISPLKTPHPFPLRYAVLAAERSQLLVLPAGRAGASSQPVLVGADLTPPSFDPFGWVWSTSALSTGSVSAVSPDGHVVVVAAPWLAGRRITSLRISREGTRALVASTDARGVGHLELAGVVRDDDLVPSALSPGGPLGLGPDLARVQAAVWLDEVDLAALARSGSDDEDRVYPLRIGGPDDQPLSPVPGASGLAAGEGAASVLVATAAGGVLQQAGSAWVPVRGLDGARDPAFAG